MCGSTRVHVLHIILICFLIWALIFDSGILFLSNISSNISNDSLLCILSLTGLEQLCSWSKVFFILLLSSHFSENASNNSLSHWNVFYYYPFSFFQRQANKHHLVQILSLMLPNFNKQILVFCFLTCLFHHIKFYKASDHQQRGSEVKVLAAKPCDLKSIPGAYVIEVEHQHIKVCSLAFFWLLWLIQTPPHINK